MCNNKVWAYTAYLRRGKVENTITAERSKSGDVWKLIRMRSMFSHPKMVGELRGKPQHVIAELGKLAPQLCGNGWECYQII